MKTNSASYRTTYSPQHLIGEHGELAALNSAPIRVRNNKTLLSM